MKGIHIRTTAFKAFIMTAFTALVITVLFSSIGYADTTVPKPTRLDIYGIEEGDIISGELWFYYIGDRHTTETWTLTSPSVKISSTEGVYTYTPPPQMNEDFVLTVTSTDNFGNKNVKAVHFTINQNAPRIKEAMYMKRTKKEHHILYTVTPKTADRGITLLKDGKTVNPDAYMMNGVLVLHEEGDYEVVINAEANGIHAHKTLKLTVDKTPPVISDLNVENGGVYASTPVLAYKMTGKESISLDSSNNYRGAVVGTAETDLVDYVLSLTTYDDLGNSTRKTIAYKVGEDLVSVPYDAIRAEDYVTLDPVEKDMIKELNGKYYPASSINALLPSFVVKSSSYLVTNHFKPISGLFAFDSESTLQKGMTVTLPYADRLTADEAKLSVYWLDLANRKWVNLHPSLNRTENTMTFFTKEDGYFIIGEGHRSFSDLAAVPEAKDVIETLASRGILNGRGGLHFEPLAEVTRAELAAMFAEALSLRSGGPVGYYTDLYSDWYADSLSLALSNKIIVSPGQKVFPMAYVTYEDMRGMLARALKHKDMLDTERFSQFSFKAPEAYVTRAEAAVMIYTLLEIIE